MKKVAILTTHRANNFGAVLQAYSLAMACREVGMDAEILDWRNPYYEWLYHTAFRFYRNPIDGFKRALVYFGGETAVRRLFDQFRRMMPMSRKITSRQVLKNIVREYDAFIVGSDQVWNPINSAIKPEDFDRANLLDFVKGRSKNAYAASIGVSEINPPSLLPEFISAWKTFDILTTREHAGAEYIRKLSGVAAEVAVDPVLLHGADFWNKIAGSTKRAGYVFLYNIRQSKLLASYAERLARDNGLELITVRIPAQSHAHCGTVVSAGPSDFVSYIKNADYVVTGSFHASAFSVIYGKKLYIEQGRSKSSPNSRISSLMSYARLRPEECVRDYKGIISFVDCATKDEGLLNSEIDKSLTYLKRIAE